TDGRWLVEGGVQDRFRRRMLAAARAADRVVVVEGGLATKLVAMGVERERVRVIPMGLDEKVFVPADREQARRALGVDPDVRLVLFVGRPTKEKGIEVLERALSSLPSSVHAVAVGPRGLEGGRIEYAGHGGPEHVAQWLAAADLLCLPSFAEGSPVSVVEALASGRPVVASAVGSIPSQVVDGLTGLLVEPGDSTGLAVALEAALERDWSADTLRESSRPFWWSKLAPRIEELYEEIL
ncbi:MAG TPA: glycosyltransferase, partial [Gaiellaceae bacterium]|nr:glycosyltransferase [Gaiellaceae bacterium]